MSYVFVKPHETLNNSYITSYFVPDVFVDHHETLDTLYDSHGHLILGVEAKF